MKCGSTSPVAMRRSASTKRRSSLTGVRRPEVTPRSTCAASSRAKWFSTRTVSSTHGSPTSSASSAPSFGRCRPVATSTVMRSRGMPAASMPSISGRRNRWLGTGRVMSQIRMQALSRPRTSVVVGRARRPAAPARRAPPRADPAASAAAACRSPSRARPRGSRMLQSRLAVEDLDRHRAAQLSFIASIRRSAARRRRVRDAHRVYAGVAGRRRRRTARRTVRGGRAACTMGAMDGSGFTDRFLTADEIARHRPRRPRVARARGQARAVHHPRRHAHDADAAVLRAVPRDARRQGRGARLPGRARHAPADGRCAAVAARRRAGRRRPRRRRRASSTTNGTTPRRSRRSARFPPRRSPSCPAAGSRRT